METIFLNALNILASFIANYRLNIALLRITDARGGTRIFRFHVSYVMFHPSGAFYAYAIRRG